MDSILIHFASCKLAFESMYMCMYLNSGAIRPIGLLLTFLLNIATVDHFGFSQRLHNTNKLFMYMTVKRGRKFGHEITVHVGPDNK